jgi:hypothetical protein
MKRIRFNKLNDWKNGILIVLSTICMFSGAFEIFGESKTEWNKILGIMSSVGIVIFFARMSFGKYYVGWNKLGITIRIKSFWGKSFNFKDIKSTKIQNRILTIVKNNGNKIELDLSKIEENDVERIIKIINENTVANNVYN